MNFVIQFLLGDLSKTQWIRKWKWHFSLEWSWKWQNPDSHSPLQLLHCAMSLFQSEIAKVSIPKVLQCGRELVKIIWNWLKIFSSRCLYIKPSLPFVQCQNLKKNYIICRGFPHDIWDILNILWTRISWKSLLTSSFQNS